MGPRSHVTAERHWLNDPNGLIQVAGTYHVFFQENPLAPFWDTPHWGHVSSADLVRWRRQERALSPTADGPDRDGCWSGCARVVDGEVWLYYTGVVGTGDDDRVESVCRAVGSPDLARWTRDPANPLVPGPPPGARPGIHRDPFLWRDGDGWHLIVSSGTDGAGAALVYDSPDARTWSYAGVFFADPRDGGPAQHWECAQVVPLDGASVLIASVQEPAAARPLSHVDYFVGELTGNRFRARARGRLDAGDALYAPAVLVDEHGRCLLWGWATEDLAPTVQERLPRAGALTLPRVLTLDGDTLRMDPAPELAGLRDEVLAAPGDPVRRPLPAGTGLQVEIAAEVDGGVEIELAGGREALRVTADVAGALAVSLTGPSGEPLFGRTAAARPGGGPLTVYRDGSLVEVFFGGEAVTTRWYATWSAGWTVSVAGAGATVWSLRDAFEPS